MSFKLPFGVEVLNPVPTDTRRGPYSAANEADAKALACAGVPPGVRGQGQQVDLIIGGVSSVFVWANGIADTDLLPLETPMPQPLSASDAPTFAGLDISGPNPLVINKTAGGAGAALHPITHAPDYTACGYIDLSIENASGNKKTVTLANASLPSGAADVAYVQNLQDANGTIALTSDIPALPFKGVFTSLAALQAAYPTASNGDSALVAGSPNDTEYYWDGDHTQWIQRSTSTVAPSFAAITGNATDNASLSSALNNKVDKITGKDLSTNDYSTVEQLKLASLPALPPLGTRGSSAIWTVIGDSRTAVDSSYRKWFEILCDLYSVNVDNRAQSGKTLQNGTSGPSNNDGSNSFEGHLDLIPTKGVNNEKLFIDLSTNDLNSNTTIYTTTSFTASYTNILNNALSKGWSGSDITLISAGYLYQGGGPSLTRQQAFKDALATIAASFNCSFIDMLTPMLALYNYNGGIYTIDGIHENNAGYDYKAHYIAPIISNVTLENKSQTLAVNGLIEAKQIKISGYGLSQADSTPMAKHNVVGADIDGQLKILPFIDVIRNVNPTDTPQAASINISGNAKVADLFMNYTGGAPTGVIRQYGSDRFLFMKPDFSDYLDVYVRNLIVSGSPNFNGRVNIGSSAWFGYGSQLIAVDANTGTTYRDITGQNYLAFGTLTVGGSSTLSGGMTIGQSQNSNLPILMQSIIVSSDGGSGAVGGAFRVYSNNNMSIGKNGYSLNIRSYDVSSGESNDLFKLDGTGSFTASQYKLSSLNTAPASSTDTGTTGEIRITSNYIYVCVATNSWVRATLSTW
jgi:hypothetical protein